MRLTGNAARQALAIAVASTAWVPENVRRELWMQFNKFDAREKRRQYRLANVPPEIVRQRLDAAASRRQRRAVKRREDYLRCLANNPCIRA